MFGFEEKNLCRQGGQAAAAEGTRAPFLGSATPINLTFKKIKELGLEPLGQFPKHELNCLGHLEIPIR